MTFHVKPDKMPPASGTGGSGLSATWVVMITKPSAEEMVEHGLEAAGYRVYVPRYRKKMEPHGAMRRPAGSMRPLFPQIVFVQQWRGWPQPPISAAERLLSLAPGRHAELHESDLAVLMAREFALEFDEVVPVGASLIRQDLEPGEEVEIDLGTRIQATLDQLTPDGRAILSACLFNRLVPTSVDAGRIIKV